MKAWLYLVFAFSLPALAEPAVVQPAQVPAPVWKTFQSATGGAQAGTIERSDEDGDVVYDVTFTAKTGGERHVSIAQDGKLLSLEMQMEDVPPPVKKTITEQIADGTLQGIEKTTDGDAPAYDVDFTLKAGGDRSLSIAEDGTLLSREVSLEEAPAEVQKTIKTQIAGGELGRIDQTFDAGEVTFDVEYADKSGKGTAFSVAPSGKLLSVDVDLKDTPAEVQQTIKDKVGAGKVTGVSKVFGAKKGAVHYEVQSEVDGKPLDFRVGAKGKFLGTDP